MVEAVTIHGRIYLGGPIAGCTDDEANTWRDIVKLRLGAEYYIDPMVRDYRGREDDSVAEIVELDKEDIDNADIVLANCWQVSWGTSMEIYYAWSKGKFVVSVVPPGLRVSPWVKYHSDLVVESLEEALSAIGYPQNGQ